MNIRPVCFSRNCLFKLLWFFAPRVWLPFFLFAAAFSPLAGAKPAFDGTFLSLPEVQVGDAIWSLPLELIDPVALTFQLDLQNINVVAEQGQAACMDPYFSIARNQLVIPVLEVGDARYQVFLDLVDANLGLFQVNPASSLLVESVATDAPAFSVWQSGNSIAIEWGSPGDDVDSYTVWFTPYQGGESIVMENLGTVTEISAELPPGTDFCLAVSYSGPEGESELSEFERFINVEVPFTSFETDNPALPNLFLPTLHENLGMALMIDAADGDRPYGAVFENDQSDHNLVLAFNPETGLLTRITHGPVVYHFINYTATTVDVVESFLDEDSVVHPNLPLSNHAITLIEGLIDEFTAPPSNPLVNPASPDPDSLQHASWGKAGIELGTDILRTIAFDSESPGEVLLEQLKTYVDGFRGDIYKTQLGDGSTQALDDAQQLLDSIVENFDCAGEPGFACAAYALNQADFDAFRLNLPESFGDQIENLLNAIADASARQMALNQDCELIVDEQEKQACLALQGNPQPGEQEDPLEINDSQDEAIAQELQALEEVFAQATQTINEASLDVLMTLNELSFDYEEYIGQRIWVTGYYGDETYNEDGYAFLLNSPTLLDKDEQLPHHSFARMNGNLPPQEWNRAEIRVYGEISDFATESGLFVTQPTPLITVIEAVQISPPVDVAVPGNPLLVDGPQFMDMPGTQASACDRVVVIAGGIDANNNKVRYRQAIAAIHAKMKALGFSDAQIEVFYDNNMEIEVDGENVVDSAAGKQSILDHLAALKAEMEPSCTLSVFVSDHGTGFETGASYGGERPAFSGEEVSGGMTYDENKFMFNAKAKTYRSTAWFEYRGEEYFMAKNAEGRINLYKKVGGNATLIGSDSDGDGIVEEHETDNDFNGDGDDDDNFGLRVAWMEARLGARRYNNNEWDSDRDGTVDVRLRWDGMRYVAERLVGEEWREMGRDTNGDFKIDETDGGVDWNLDGDKDDQVGFHEGINLWGNEVLWDDELAAALKMLSDEGIHINAFMASCFSGGFVSNLRDFVENIFTGSDEDEVHWSRDDGTGKLIHDTRAFLDNLHGIDPDSWEHAGDKAVEADMDAAGEDGEKNDYTRYMTPKYPTLSVFEYDGNGEYKVELDFPDTLDGLIYDFEFIFGLQLPRWTAEDVEILEGLPDDAVVEGIPGGIRVFSPTLPFINSIKFRMKATEGAQMLRIELTDFFHERWGYTMAVPGVVNLLEEFASDSVFEDYGATRKIRLDIPDELVGQVYDFEFYFENQIPPWTPPVLPMPGLLPPDIQFEEFPGGIRFFSELPIPDNLVFELLAPLNIGGSILQIQLTDSNHDPLGFLVALPGTTLLPPPLLLDPCLIGDFDIIYNDGILVPDPLQLNCNGQALLGAPAPNGNAGPFQAEWFLDDLGFGISLFEFGGNFFAPPPLFPPLFPDQPGLPLPIPPSPCIVDVQFQHLGLFGQNAMICPTNPVPVLELNNGRFQVEANWESSTESGLADGFNLTEDSGGLFFTDPMQLELLLKVIDGCAINGHFWLLSGATTDLAFELQVTDTQTSHTREYTNPLGSPFSPILDTEAFATCP